MKKDTIEYLKLAEDINRNVHFQLVYDIAKIHHYSLKHNVIPLFEFGKNDGGLYRSEEKTIKNRLYSKFEEYKYRRMTDEEFEKSFSTTNFRSAVMGGKKNPPTGFAIILGKTSNLVAMDFDTYTTEGNVEIPKDLKSLVMDKTPNGGTHSYAKWDDSLELVSTTNKKAKELIYIPHNEKDFAVELLLNQLVLVNPSMVLSKDGTFIGQYEYVVGGVGDFLKLPKLTSSVVEKYLKRSDTQNIDKPQPGILAQRFQAVNNQFKLTTRQVQQEPSLLPTYLQQWHCDKLNLPEGASRHDAMLQIANSMFHYDFPDELVYQAIEYAKNGFIEKDRKITDEEISNIVRDAKNNVGDNKYTPKAQNDKAIVSIKEWKTPSLSEFIDGAKKQFLEGKTLGIPSGYPSLDEITSGLVPGQTYVAFAFTSVGKSVFVLNILNYQAKQGIKCMYFDLENDKTESLERQVLINEGDLTKTMWQSLIKAKKIDEPLGKLKNLPLYTWDLTNLYDRFGNITFEAVETCIQEGLADGYKIFAIDHLHYFDPEVTDYNKLADITRKLNDIAAINNVVILIVAHTINGLMYENERTGEIVVKRPLIEHIRGSKLISRHTKNTIALMRNDLAPSRFIRSQTTVFVDKTKAGPSGMFRLEFNPDNLRFIENSGYPIDEEGIIWEKDKNA